MTAALLMYTPSALEQADTLCQTKQCIKQKQEGAVVHGKAQMLLHDM